METMTLKELAQLSRNVEYTKITEWAEQTGIDKMEEVDFLLFSAEAYEKTGCLEKAAQAYERAVKEFEDDNAATALLNLYKNTDNTDALTELAAYLDEQGIMDDIMLLARFEALRAGKAEMDEQIDALKEYMDECYNDELYHILLMELLLETGDGKALKRLLNKFWRVFANSEYKETYVTPLEQSLEQNIYGQPDSSIRELIYKKIVTRKEEPQKETVAVAVNVEKAEPDKADAPKPVARPKAPAKKVRANLVSSKDILNEHTSRKKGKKNKEKNAEPPTMDERFQDVYGMKNVRDKVGNIYRVLKFQSEKDVAFSVSNFIITGKRGSGKTLLAVTMAQILVDFGIRGEEDAVSVEAKEFCDKYNDLENDADKLKDRTLIIENLERAMDQQGVYGDFAWKLRQYMIAHKEDMSIILTGSKDAALKLLEEEKDIGELVYPIRDTYDIDEYSTDELMEIMELEAAIKKCQLSQKAKECVRRQLDKEKKMTTFAYAKSIQEKIESAITKAANRVDLKEDVSDNDFCILTEEDFEADSISGSIDELLDQLDKMTGLDSVKEEVSKLINKIIVEQEAEKAGVEKKKTAEPLHMVFKGGPGTGKTTVARIIGEIYIALGILPGNKAGLVECTSKDLVGQYVGETAQKTQAKIDEAMGGVLFIDEAYSLTQNQFGKESITTLLTTLENNSDSIMVIFAGYPEDMDEFLDLNPGLRSRIPKHIMFEDYTPEEMVSIFRELTSKNGRFLAPDTNDLLKELLRQASMGLDFGNARGVRRVFNEVENAQKDRLGVMLTQKIMPTSNDFVMFRKEDFESVLESYQAGARPLDELLEDLNNTEGMQELKDVVNRAVNTVKAYRKKKENGISARLEIDSLHMVFSGAPGTGKTTMARKVGAIYKALGILPRGNELCECAGNDLLGKAIGDAANIVKDKIKHSMGGILFVDEAYQLSNNNNPYGQEACDTFIKELEDKRDKFMLILAGYTKEMEDFMDTNPGFRSRIPHVIHFEDYSVDQMVSIFKKMVAEKEYTLEEDADEVIRKVLEKKSTGKDFGNARGVRNVLREVIENLDFRIANEDVPAEEFAIIRKVDIEKVVETGEEEAEEKDVDAILAELDSMVGLGSVKEAVHKIVEMAQYNKWAQEEGIDEEGFGSMHMLFKGNAGTGKTTVARMIGQIYKQLGVLRSGQLVECGRDSLVAGYVGQTAEKTQAVINSAMGGILFVDEAYTLVGKGENDFGNEALTTIMKAMEDHRDDLMVIFAGYSKEIDELIATNQGLESRFSKQNEIVFEDYTPDELLQIFLFQAKGMIVEEELYPFIQEVIGKAQAEAASFGNARGVRNIVDSVNGFRKQRIQGMIRSGQKPDAQTAMTITREDLEKI